MPETTDSHSLPLPYYFLSTQLCKLAFSMFLRFFQIYTVRSSQITSLVKVYFTCVIFLLLWSDTDFPQLCGVSGNTHHSYSSQFFLVQSPLGTKLRLPPPATTSSFCIVKVSWVLVVFPQGPQGPLLHGSRDGFLSVAIHKEQPLSTSPLYLLILPFSFVFHCDPQVLAALTHCIA